MMVTCLHSDNNLNNPEEIIRAVQDGILEEWFTKEDVAELLEISVTDAGTGLSNGDIKNSGRTNKNKKYLESHNGSYRVVNFEE